MRTINQIIADAKDGKTVDGEECKQTMLALHSMLIQSRMAIESVALHIGNELNTHTAARCLLGNLDFVRNERDSWLNSIPSVWLMMNKIE